MAGTNQSARMQGTTYSLPDDDVVQHGASAKDDSQGDHDARADGWRRRELKYRIQDHICTKLMI